MRRRQLVTLAATSLASPLLYAGPAAQTGGVIVAGLDGSRVTVGTSSLARLRRELPGQVFFRGQDQFRKSISIWTAGISRVPAIVIRPDSAEGVSAALRFASSHDLAVCIRSGGHNHAGYALSDNALMLDLSGMKQLELSSDETRVRVGPGITCGEFDVATHRVGRAATGPIVSMVGMPGYTLGGGIGWLHRKFGAGCDNLVGAQVVLADGQVLDFDEQTDPGLLWAMRGGGANLAVATRLDYRIRRLSNVYAGLIFFDLEALPKVAGFVDEYLDNAPDDLSVWMFHRKAPPSPALPESVWGVPVMMLAVTWTGNRRDAEAVVQPLRQIAPPLADLVTWRPYPAWQAALDGAWGNGFQNEWVGGYLDRYGPEEQAVVRRYAMSISSGHSDVKVARLGGAFANGSDSAFGSREARYAYVIQARWPAGESGRDHLAWTQQFHTDMRALDTGQVYVNFIGAQEPPSRVEDAYDAGTMARLKAVKHQMDPNNRLRHNANFRA